MPSLGIKILILLKEGLYFYISNPLRPFKIGGSYKLGTYYSAIRRLEKQGYVEKWRGNREKKFHIRLTEKGEKFIEKHRKKGEAFSRQWDKRWRIVIFDIPEDRRIARDRFRRYLKVLGFGNVQRSIWISPFDFTEAIREYLEKLNLTEYVFQIRAEDFEGISKPVLVEKFWQINKLNNRYLDLIERYKKRRKEFFQRMGDTPELKDHSLKFLKEQLAWDYRSILARDPHLPAEVLPADWGGDKAREFMEKFLN